MAKNNDQLELQALRNNVHTGARFAKDALKDGMVDHGFDGTFVAVAAIVIDKMIHEGDNCLADLEHLVFSIMGLLDIISGKRSEPLPSGLAITREIQQQATHVLMATIGMYHSFNGDDAVNLVGELVEGDPDVAAAKADAFLNAFRGPVIRAEI